MRAHVDAKIPDPTLNFHRRPPRLFRNDNRQRRQSSHYSDLNSIRVLTGLAYYRCVLFRNHSFLVLLRRKKPQLTTIRRTFFENPPTAPTRCLTRSPRRTLRPPYVTALLLSSLCSHYRPQLAILKEKKKEKQKNTHKNPRQRY